MGDKNRANQRGDKQPWQSSIDIRKLRINNMPRIMLKCTMPNAFLIPPGCRPQNREGQRTLERDYAQCAVTLGMADAAKYERLRDGHYDTGDAMVVNPESPSPNSSVGLKCVSLDALREALVVEGFVFADLSYYTKQMPPGQHGEECLSSVIQMDYVRGAPPFVVAEDVQSSIDTLLNKTVWMMHTYANLDGTVTVNLGRRENGPRAKYRMVVADGRLTAVAA